MEEILENDDEPFYKKRFEIIQQERELLKRENDSLKKEMMNLKLTFHKIIDTAHINSSNTETKQENNNSSNDLVLILEMQRKRIETLEIEYSSLQRKYEKGLFENGKNVAHSKVKVSEYSASSEQLVEAQEKISMLEQTIQEITTSHAKELAQLKSKMIEQDAHIILNNGKGNLESFSTPNIKKGAKKATLEPIIKSQNFSANSTGESLFKYKKNNSKFNIYSFSSKHIKSNNHHKELIINKNNFIFIK